MVQPWHAHLGPGSAVISARRTGLSRVSLQPCSLGLESPFFFFFLPLVLLICPQLHRILNAGWDGLEDLDASTDAVGILHPRHEMADPPTGSHVLSIKQPQFARESGSSSRREWNAIHFPARHYRMGNGEKTPKMTHLNFYSRHYSGKYRTSGQVKCMAIAGVTQAL